MPKINSLEVVHQDTNKDSYDNLHDILVALKDAVGLSKKDGNYLVNKEVIDGQARAAYETLLEMYVNDKEAFARRLETLTAEFGTSIAQVLEEWTVYASATEAYAKKIEEVSAKAFQNEAKVTEEMYARVTADEAVAKLVTTLRADFENAQTRSKASIREEQIARANADEALASRSFVMEASIADNTAMITEEQLVRATADEALASNITSLTSTVATNTASILTEQITRANADSALAIQINTVSATAGNKNRTYVQTTAPTGSTLVPLVSGDLWFDSDDNYKLYRYSGSTWDAVDDSRIAATATAVSTETSARVTADSALGTQINSVVARLDTGDFATVKTQAAASVAKAMVYAQTSQPTGGTYTVGDLWIDTDGDNKMYRWNGSSWTFSDVSTIKTFSQTSPPTAVNIGDLWLETDNNNKLWRWDGSSWIASDDGRIPLIEARWGVTVNANNQVAGIQLLSGSSTQSSFTVDATKFIVKKPDGTNGIVWNGSNSRLDISGDVYANNFYGNVVSTGNVNSGAIGNVGAIAANTNDLTLYLPVTGNMTGETYIIYIIAQWPQTYFATTSIYLNGSLIRTASPAAPTEGTLAVTSTVGPGTHTIRAVNGDNRNSYMSIYAQVVKR